MSRSHQRQIGSVAQRRKQEKPATTHRRTFGPIHATLSVLIFGGATYVLWPAAPSGVAPAPANVAIQSPGEAREPSHVSGVVVELDGLGKKVARVDMPELRSWCRVRGLPDPPDLSRVELDVLVRFVEAFEKVAAQPSAESLGRIGMLYAGQLAYEEAGECFRRAGRLSPGDFRWAYFLGCVQQNRGRFEDAISSFEEGLRLNSTYPTTHARLGQLYLYAGKLDEAETHFRKYRELEPQDWFGSLGLGRIALERNQADLALELLTEAERMGAADFQVQFNLGRAHADRGDATEAERRFALAAELPHGAWFHGRDPLEKELKRAAGATSLLARDLELQTESRDWAKLASIAEEIVHRRPDDVTTICNLAQFHRKMSRQEDARKWIDRARQLAPTSARVHAVDADLWFAVNRNEEALAAADRALSLDSDNALALGIRGRVLLLSNRWMEAETALRRAVERNPTDVTTIVSLGEALRLQGKTKDAVENYRRALELKPDYAAARQRLRELESPP